MFEILSERRLDTGSSTDLDNEVIDEKQKKITYFLVDFENIQEFGINQLNGRKNFRLIMFVGAKQTRIPISLSMILQKFGDKVAYLIVTDIAKNALDFQLTFELGRLAAANPLELSAFQIISNDKGFDTVISRMLDLGIDAKRVNSINTKGVS